MNRTTLILLATVVWSSDVFAADVPKIDFVRDVEPLLRKHCFECHGEDSQEGQLRLDAKSIVFKGGKNGPSVVPGKGAASLLVKRVIENKNGNRMPLDEPALSAKEIGILKAWIDQGAIWPDGVGSQIKTLGKHWAYVKPQRPLLPSVKNRGWVRNPIDAFVLARLEKEKLTPSPEAARVRLIRRVTLDLTGLPPTPREIDAFVGDEKPGAYARVVDRLLASPRYGERWATPWLDAARYTDSNGYQRDGRRVYWAYRDWVIRALNADMPFDRFTVEQIAGDLLPNATLDQKIATGFHRGTMANVEAGTDPDEEHFLAVVDRVNTTGAVWLGTTVECMQCHNHKYDPFTQEEFYGLFAFFNNTEKEITRRGSARSFVGPKISLPLTATQQAERRRLDSQTQSLNRQLQALSKKLAKQQIAWELRIAGNAVKTDWQILDPRSFRSLNGAVLTERDDLSLLATGERPATDIYEVTSDTDLSKITAFRLEVLTDPSLPGKGPGRNSPANFILSEFRVEILAADASQKPRRVEIASAFADYSQRNWPIKNAIDGNRKTGWAVAKQFGRGHQAVFIPQSPVKIAKGSRLRFTLDQQYGGARTIGRFQLMVTAGNPKQLGGNAGLKRLAQIDRSKRTAKQQQQLTTAFRAQSSDFQQLQKRKLKLSAASAKILAPTTLVMKELSKPRITRMYKRGDFLKPGKTVTSGTPATLHALPDKKTSDRLSLAKWLVDSENPLTARVTVNRHWAEFFGRGIVETIEDFGTQGDRPTHPQLLDWLATEFQQTGWSTKRLHRTIVTSATYRQSARVTRALLERDRYNTLFARGPRFRLKAEFVRDNALAVAGLLSDAMHGPPVFPVQPPGVWNHIGAASNLWKTSTGGNLHRRGLYIYWRRTVPYPSLVNFDAPSREACTVKRSRSNTPLQALTLMNDPVFFEAAVTLAQRMTTEPEKSAAVVDRIAHGFRLATSRRPNSLETTILQKRFHTERSRYKKNPAALKTLLTNRKTPPNVDAADFAAWIHVANVLLNLDEVISR